MITDTFGNKIEGARIKFLGFPLKVNNIELSINNMDLSLIEVAKIMRGMSLILHTEVGTLNLNFSSLTIRDFPSIIPKKENL
jgi:hypothetical protein